MLDTNPERIARAAQQAFDACTGKKFESRWQRAIAKASSSLNPTLTFTFRQTARSSSPTHSPSTRRTASASVELT
jgi:hypothetical protein